MHFSFAVGVTPNMYPRHHTVLDFIFPKIFNEEYKLWSPSSKEPYQMPPKKIQKVEKRKTMGRTDL
jgi:hypothetical protein